MREILRSRDFKLSDDYKKMYDLKRRLMSSSEVNLELEVPRKQDSEFRPDLPKNRSVGQLLRSTNQLASQHRTLVSS